MPVARLLIDSACSGTWNMGVDQALLESADSAGVMTVRFYRWEPTLSLGYFQNLDSRNDHVSSRDCPLVRRTTGGGAILHDHEITYSLAIPSENRWAKVHEQLYWTMHRCIVEVLNEFQIVAGLYKDPDCEIIAPPESSREVIQSNGLRPQSNSHKTSGCGSGKGAESTSDVSFAPHSFLCFERRTPGDIVLSGFKIGGSAQRRKQNAILQHGSLLFRRSIFALELPGIEDLEGSPELDQSTFLNHWIAKLESSLQIDLAPEPMTQAEIDRAHHFEQIFSSTEWNMKTTNFRIY